MVPLFLGAARMRSPIAAFFTGALFLLTISSAYAAAFVYKGTEHATGHPKQTYTVKPNLTAPVRVL